MRKLATAVVLALTLGMSVAGAEQIYLRNRLFKGPVVGTGRNTMVGAVAFAEAMGLKITEQDGATILHPPEVRVGTDFGSVDAGAVYVVGKKVESSAGPGGAVMIPLFASAEAAGARAVPNRSMGTIDVNMLPKPAVAEPTQPEVAADATAADSTTPEASGDAVDGLDAGEKPVKKPVKRGVIPGTGDTTGLKVLTVIPPKQINRPGAAVDYRQHLVSGRYNLVLFGANW